jgi:Tat protein translocase TatB subunit
MFDLSFAEIALVVVVGAVFIGPNELPTVVRSVMKAFRYMKKLSTDIKQMFDEVADDDSIKQVTDPLEYEMRMIRGDDGKLYESFLPIGEGEQREEQAKSKPHTIESGDD